ncbi:hypothetical protein L7F22_063660 [Adiantum nelumboides]|nr:hypothetical protein [Adiantum nelumboides]
MLNEGNLPKLYWAEVVNTSVHLMNMSPTEALTRLTPEEAYSGIKPNVSTLKVFGCVAYMHIPDEKRRKLDVKSERCVFTGYDMYSKGGSRILHQSYEEVSMEGENTTSQPQNSVMESTISHESAQDIAQEDASLQSINSATCPDSHIHEEDSTLKLRRSPRVRQPTQRLTYTSNFTNQYSAFMAKISHIKEPQSYEEDFTKQEWLAAMDEEYNALLKNDTWKLVDLPQGKKTIGSKWVYKVKLNVNGSIDKHKARLVAKGFAQHYGEDYDETFAPVAKMTMVRLTIALATFFGWILTQMDVNNAFLNGNLEEEVYMHQPQGYVDYNHAHKVCQLRKALYGLKQTSRAWYKKIDIFFVSLGFHNSSMDPTLYIKSNNNDIILLILYVDDLIIIVVSPMASKRTRFGGANDHEAGTSNVDNKDKAPVVDEIPVDSQSNQEEIVVVFGRVRMKDSGIRKLFNQFEEVQLYHIPRKENKDAALLALQAVSNQDKAHVVITAIALKDPQHAAPIEQHESLEESLEVASLVACPGLPQWLGGNLSNVIQLL